MKFVQAIGGVIAGLIAVVIVGACVVVLACWTITEYSDVLCFLAGSPWQAWSISLLSVLVDACAVRGRACFRSTSCRRLKRSVEHVHATLFSRTCIAVSNGGCR